MASVVAAWEINMDAAEVFLVNDTQGSSFSFLILRLLFIVS